MTSHRFPLEEFVFHFKNELAERSEINTYHKLFESKFFYPFRMAYYWQRLLYIANHLPKKCCTILDLGCGYGTTAFYLALNGHIVKGITLDEFFKPIEKRLIFWNKLGSIDIELFSNDFLSTDIQPNSFDVVITQDTLHHLEPIPESLKKIKDVLKEDGKVIVCEENGLNLLHSLRLFLRRGNKRVIYQYDSHLDRNVLVGNENIRSQKKWSDLFTKNGLKIDGQSIEYIRFLPPLPFFNFKTIISIEQKFFNMPSITIPFFHGINFTAGKS